MYSPLSVRLLLKLPSDAGKIAGGLFAISSLGNILGIIVTTFFLIPSIGTRSITAGFATFLLASGFVSLVTRAIHRGDNDGAGSSSGLRDSLRPGSPEAGGQCEVGPLPLASGRISAAIRPFGPSP